MKAAPMTTIEFAEEIQKFLDPSVTETYRLEDLLEAKSGNTGLDSLKGAVTALFLFYADERRNGLVSERGRAWLRKLIRILNTNDDYQFVYELIIRGLEAEAEIRQYGKM